MPYAVGILSPVSIPYVWIGFRLQTPPVHYQLDI